MNDENGSTNLAEFLQHFFLFGLQLLVCLENSFLRTLSLLPFFILFTHYRNNSLVSKYQNII